MAWQIVRWPAAFAFAVTAIASVYHFAPDVKRESCGSRRRSVAATALWLVISLGFAVCVPPGTISKHICAIGGVMVTLLWFYFSGSILLGATTERDDRPRLATPSGEGAEGRVSPPSGRPYIVACAAPCPELNSVAPSISHRVMQAA